MTWEMVGGLKEKSLIQMSTIFNTHSNTNIVKMVHAHLGSKGRSEMFFQKTHAAAECWSQPATLALSLPKQKIRLTIMESVC